MHWKANSMGQIFLEECKVQFIHLKAQNEGAKKARKAVQRCRPKLATGKKRRRFSQKQRRLERPRMCKISTGRKRRRFSPKRRRFDPEAPNLSSKLPDGSPTHSHAQGRPNGTKRHSSSASFASFNMASGWHLITQAKVHNSKETC